MGGRAAEVGAGACQQHVNGSLERMHFIGAVVVKRHALWTADAVGAHPLDSPRLVFNQHHDVANEVRSHYEVRSHERPCDGPQVRLPVHALLRPLLFVPRAELVRRRHCPVTERVRAAAGRRVGGRDSKRLKGVSSQPSKSRTVPHSSRLSAGDAMRASTGNELTGQSRLNPHTNRRAPNRAGEGHRTS